MVSLLFALSLICLPLIAVIADTIMSARSTSYRPTIWTP